MVTAFLDLSSLDEGSYEVGLYYKGDDGLWSPMQAEQANASAFRLVIGTETVTMEKIHPDFRIALAEDFQPGYFVYDRPENLAASYHESGGCTT